MVLRAHRRGRRFARAFPLIAGLALVLAGTVKFAGTVKSQEKSLTPLTPEQMQLVQQLSNDMVQTNDIAALKEKQKEQEEHLAATDRTVIDQGKDISAISARSTVWDSILSAILGGIIGKTYFRKDEAIG